MAGRVDRQPGHDGDAQPGRDQRLRRDMVVCGEGDLRAEPSVLAEPDQVAPAVLTPGYPGAVRVGGQVGQPGLARRGLAAARLSATRRSGTGLAGAGLAATRVSATRLAGVGLSGTRLAHTGLAG